jgi:hypothetical protein
MIRDELVNLLLNLLNRHAASMDVEYIASKTMSDWNALLVMGEMHKILPLLFHRLERLGLKSAVPQEIWLGLRRKYLANFAHNLMLYGELSRIAPLLQAEQIPVIALKGMHLAQTVYRHIALRQMIDIDILVPPALAPRAWELLVSHGYQNLPGHTAACDVHIKQQHHLARLTRPGVAAVEIHWSLIHPNQNESLDLEDIQGIWDRAKPIHLGSRQLLSLSPEDLLLHLCLHTSYLHHFEFGLQPSCDIAWTINHFGTSLNWGHLIERTCDWGWERGVSLALRLAHDLMRARVPEAAWARLKKEENAEHMVALAKEQIFANPNAIRVSKNFAHFWEETSLRGRVGRLLDRIFLTPEIMAIHYPMGSNSLNRYWYYLVRLWVLLRRYTRLGWQLLQGNAALAENIKRKDQLTRWLAGN